MCTGLNVPALLQIAASRGDHTRYAIAKRSGVSQQTMMRLVAGKTPSMPTLYRLASAYGVAVAELLIGTESQSEAA